jgi:hypothetical protein
VTGARAVDAARRRLREVLGDPDRPVITRAEIERMSPAEKVAAFKLVIRNELEVNLPELPPVDLPPGATPARAVPRVRADGRAGVPVIAQLRADGAR